MISSTSVDVLHLQAGSSFYLQVETCGCGLGVLPGGRKMN